MSIKTKNTRDTILQATLDLLLAGDGTKTRMSDVAKRAGVSRQAVYLHFENRADLLIAATQMLDGKLNIDAQLAPSRAAQSGIERLEAYVSAWGSYVPKIYGAAKALIDMGTTDPAAAAAWDKRMQDMREGCEAAIAALHHDGTLAPCFNQKDATDVLWTMLLVGNWEHCTLKCGWSQKKYVELLTSSARQLFYSAPPNPPESG